ncbi:hypothetical protein [Campylobacter armoricus]|uniref:Uncharacterized protein n=1 Tax=Campylobacter armoricus TaxID=2505970 RepID=A0A7L5HMS2_9BACT|nr:hypothetical protein [Campylobacter armoricus]QKF79532.1 hypothetical protein CARM_0614 [Campylobacter armoricus]
MIPIFKASMEVANYQPLLEYLNEGGLYSGYFRKIFLYDTTNNAGNVNTFVKCEFICQKHNKLADFSLFIAKNGDFTYTNSKGEKESYLGFRQLNAIMLFLGVEELDFNEKIKANVYGKEMEVISLDELTNKTLVLGFDTEEFLNKNNQIENKIVLSRIFNSKLQSFDEFKNQKESVAYKNFKAKHKKLPQEQNEFQAQSISFDPYSQNFNPKPHQTHTLDATLEDDGELPF